MKTKLCLSLLFVVALVACNNNQPEPNGDIIPEGKLAIIKLSAEMQNKIFVSPMVDSAYIDINNNITLFYKDELALNNPTELDKELADFAEKELHIVGTSPYLLLDNGYAIIDWKWSQFHPLSGEVRRPLYINEKPVTCIAYSTNRFFNIKIENEAYYLLNTGWETLKTLSSTWGIDEGTLIERPEIRYINFIKIEEYGNYKKSIKDINKKYNVGYSSGWHFNDLRLLHSNDKDAAIQLTQEYNNLQSSYVETLNEMIKNDDFNKYTQWK